MSDERAYYECNKCSYAVSGHSYSSVVNDKLDRHEDENPGHRMIEAKDY
jgi:hypothetical protein